MCGYHRRNNDACGRVMLAGDNFAYTCKETVTVKKLSQVRELRERENLII